MNPRLVRCISAMLVAACPLLASAQQAGFDVRSPDSVTMAAGAHYDAGGFHRFLFGGTYRDLWTTQIRVPVLNLRTFGGGLLPVKQGGGFETTSLRLVSPDGAEYSFRSIDKRHGPIPAGMIGVGLANEIAGDQTSSSFPAAAVVVSVLLDAAGVLQASPVLVVMPDDTLLGKYRKTFGHMLGTLERHPTKGKGARPGFANAVDIIDSDTLRVLIDRNPAEHVDAPAFLAARLADMLVNNWDRHPGQWTWARLLPAPHGAWEPISQDFDKAFISTGGFLPGLMRQAVPSLVTFDSTYPSMRALTWNSLEFDRRLLAGLSRPQWDSVARALKLRLTDSVIDAAMRAMPIEYRRSAPALVAKLRFRRDSLPVVAARFYTFLAGVVDIHATDAADRAVVTRVDNQFVDVRLETRDGEPYFIRRFDARETTAIRLYLHGGDDQARITGDVNGSIPVRIIGGNAANQLVDASTVDGKRNVAHFYDQGQTGDVSYAPDTLFDRRPLIRQFGGRTPAVRDYGSSSSPLVDVTINHDMGIEPRLGMTWYRYGFRDAPYSSRLSLEGRYSFKVSGLRLSIAADQRRESSAIHFTELARMSQLEMVNYHGLGNSSPETPGLLSGVSAPRTDYYAVNQRQWLFQPAIAMALGSNTDLSFGPVIQYSVTDSLPNRFVSATLPYGSGAFGEAGLRLGFLHTDRTPVHHPHSGTMLDVSATWYPGVWDVRTAFTVLNAVGAVYVTLPVPTHPYLTLRAGAKKVIGDFPFQESAFIGGRADVRTFDLQRFAGDAAAFATAELRIPVARFTLVLPLNTGLLATEDVGRVYVKGDSPGGWHNALGAGFWIAFHELSLDVRVMRANEVGRPAALALRFVLPGAMQ